MERWVALGWRGEGLSRGDAKDPWDLLWYADHTAASWHGCVHADNAASDMRHPMNTSQRQHLNKQRNLSTAAALAFGIISSLGLTPKAEAQTASGLLTTWGKACKMKVVEQFDVPMSDALLNIGATEKQSLAEGTTSLADIKKTGMSYNWEIRGKKISGYCNVNGSGKITEFKQGL